MAPVASTPRELLWYHQIQRENRHLLERMNKQQAEIDQIKSQLSTDEEQRAKLQQTLSRLEEKQGVVLERRREDFEREKGLLKRIGTLEASVAALKSNEDSQHADNEVAERWQMLEQRVNIVEEQQAVVPSQDTRQLELKIEVLEKSMHHAIVRSVQTDPQPTAKEQATKETLDALRSHSVGHFGGSSGSKQASTEDVGVKRQLPDQELQPILDQKKRRRERETRIPFRPTPADMAW